MIGAQTTELARHREVCTRCRSWPSITYRQRTSGETILYAHWLPRDDGRYSLQQNGEGDPEGAHTYEEEHVGALDPGKLKVQIFHTYSSRATRDGMIEKIGRSAKTWNTEAARHRIVSASRCRASNPGPVGSSAVRGRPRQRITASGRRKA